MNDNSTNLKEKDTLFNSFQRYTITELQELMDNSQSREESIFFNKLLNLKLTFAQEKVVGEELL